MVSKGVCRIFHVRHFAVCSPTVDGGTTARGSDDGDQCQRGPLPPGPHADGSAVISDVSLALSPWRSTDEQEGCVANFAQEVVKGQLPLSVEGFSGQGVEQLAAVRPSAPSSTTSCHF